MDASELLLPDGIDVRYVRRAVGEVEHKWSNGDGSKIEFSSQGNGGAKEMNVVIFDEPVLYSGGPQDSNKVQTMTVSAV